MPAPHRTRILLEHCFTTPLPFTVVKVTGTNGKGSTCAMLASCLAADGYITGRFTSPHLSKVEERITVLGAPASFQDLQEAASVVIPAIDRVVATFSEEYAPTYFEALLLIALQLFRRRGVRVAVIEAGIGGAYDAVSAVPGIVSVISTIGLDHIKELGGTESEIARDKAEIADQETSLVVGTAVSADARAAIEEVARKRKVRLVFTTPGRIRQVRIGVTRTMAEALYRGAWHRIQVALAGRYQLANVETTLTALDVLADIIGITPTALRGFDTVVWAGRFESIGSTPRWLLDVAHNPDAIQALRRALDEVVPYKQRVLLCGMSQQHATRSLGEGLRQLAPRFYVADAFYQAAAASTVCEYLEAPSEVLGNPIAAVRFLSDRYCGSRVTILVAGSLYLVGSIRPLLTSL